MNAFLNNPQPAVFAICQRLHAPQLVVVVLAAVLVAGLSTLIWAIDDVNAPVPASATTPSAIAALVSATSVLAHLTALETIALVRAAAADRARHRPHRGGVDKQHGLWWVDSITRAITYTGATPRPGPTPARFVVWTSRPVLGC